MSLVYSTEAEPLSRVQLKRRILLAALMLGAAILLPFVCSAWLHDYPLFHSQIEHVGIFLIFAAIFGRTWCALHIGGRKKEMIVDTGPYSVVRNPLYVFTIIGAAGIGAQTSSLTVTAVSTLVVGLVFAAVVQKEEAFLAAKFGAAYDDYSRRVPRFFPNFTAYRNVPQLTINTRLVRRTFVESCYFLIAIPAFDMLELARDYSWIPDRLHLP